MDLLSLPPEILSVICQYVILADLGPERRLHPCTNCRYLRKGVRRRELSCPPLLLCCRDLTHIGSEVFYQNVTIVLGLDHHSQPFYFRCYPTPDTDKDTFSVVTNRTLVLPHIRNLELMISRSISYNPETRDFQQDIFFRSQSENPMATVSALTIRLPKLKSLSWTVGIGTVPNESIEIWPHVANVEGVHPVIDDESVFRNRSAWPVPLSYYHRLSAVLAHRPCTVDVTSFRLWLTRTHLQRLHDYVHGKKTLEGALSDQGDAIGSPSDYLPTHTFLKAIIQLPALNHLDIFIPQDDSTYSPYILNLGRKTIDDSTIGKLKDTLREVFWHVDHVQFWRARSENVTTGDYEPFPELSAYALAIQT